MSFANAVNRALEMLAVLWKYPCLGPGWNRAIISAYVLYGIGRFPSPYCFAASLLQVGLIISSLLKAALHDLPVDDLGIPPRA